jgi:predicted RNA binding protein YcfA (HicA-like mRNA interferase family)
MLVRELERQLATVGYVLDRLEGNARWYTHAATGRALVVNTYAQHRLVTPRDVEQLWRTVSAREEVRENA